MEDAPRPEITPHGLVVLTDAQGHPRHPSPHRPVLDACRTCPSPCCTHHEVRVLLPDAARFLNVLGLPFTIALRFVPSTSRWFGFRIDDDPRGPAEQDGRPWTTLASIALRRRDNGDCAMFQRLGTFGRCGAYAARPTDCRLYPLSWRIGDDVGGPEVVYCPLPYGVDPSAEDRFREDATWGAKARALHQEVIAAWHAAVPEGDRTARGFLEFALPRTSEPLGYDPAPMLDNRSAPEQNAALADAAFNR